MELEFFSAFREFGNSTVNQIEELKSNLENHPRVYGSQDFLWPDFEQKAKTASENVSKLQDIMNPQTSLQTFVPASSSLLNLNSKHLKALTEKLTDYGFKGTDCESKETPEVIHEVIHEQASNEPIQQKPLPQNTETPKQQRKRKRSLTNSPSLSEYGISQSTLQIPDFSKKLRNSTSVYTGERRKEVQQNSLLTEDIPEPTLPTPKRSRIHSNQPNTASKRASKEETNLPTSSSSTALQKTDAPPDNLSTSNTRTCINTSSKNATSQNLFTKTFPLMTPMSAKVCKKLEPTIQTPFSAILSSLKTQSGVSSLAGDKNIAPRSAYASNRKSARIASQPSDESEKLSTLVDESKKLLSDQHVEVNEALKPSQIAAILNNKAGILHQKHNFIEAEPLYQHALSLYEIIVGPDHADVAVTLTNMAALFKAQKRYSDSSKFFQRALSIRENKLGSNHADVGTTWWHMASLARAMGNDSQAQLYFGNALKIYEDQLGSSHKNTIAVKQALAKLRTTRN